MCLYGGILLLPLALFTNYYAAQSVCFKQKRKKKNLQSFVQWDIQQKCLQSLGRLTTTGQVGHVSHDNILPDVRQVTRVGNQQNCCTSGEVYLGQIDADVRGKCVCVAWLAVARNSKF